MQCLKSACLFQICVGLIQMFSLEVRTKHRHESVSLTNEKKQT